MRDALLMGAVAYDPKVVTIWDGFKEYFAQRGLAFDFVLYSTYERQVRQHLAGAIHVAWNSPLAWLQTERAAKALGREAHAVCMRDTDRDLTSVVLVRSDAAIATLADLAGRSVGVGARDSPQATLIPLLHIEEAGLRRDRDFQVRLFDVHPGKHGDHVGGERDAVRALVSGEVDAACAIDSNRLLFASEGTIPAGSVRVLSQTGTYDHCNFTVLDDAPKAGVESFRRLLLEMRYDDPRVRHLLDLEGLKSWCEGRTEGYTQLERAVQRFGTIDAFVAELIDEVS